jgi:phosphonate transport system substrate-binding protein
MYKVFGAACILLALAAGCSKPETAPPEKAVKEASLVIGLIPEQHIFDQVERYKPLADYLSKKVGVKIKLKVLSRYGNIIDNFVSSGMDGAFFGSFTYALAHAKLGVEVLARPENLDGRSTYYGLIFVRRDSGIRTVKDMAGKRFAFVDKATTAGYLLPLDYFNRNGIRNYRTYLKEAYFAGTHEDAISDVLNGKADIGAAKSTIYDKLMKENEKMKKEMVVLEKSPDVPENGLAVRKDLDDSLKRKLKGALLDMHDDPEGAGVLKNFGARRFIETTDKDYEPVLKYAKESGLNLSTYDYMNE